MKKKMGIIYIFLFFSGGGLGKMGENFGRNKKESKIKRNFLAVCCFK